MTSEDTDKKNEFAHIIYDQCVKTSERNEDVLLLSANRDKSTKPKNKTSLKKTLEKNKKKRYEKEDENEEREIKEIIKEKEEVKEENDIKQENDVKEEFTEIEDEKEEKKEAEKEGMKEEIKEKGEVKEKNESKEEVKIKENDEVKEKSVNKYEESDQENNNQHSRKIIKIIIEVIVATLLEFCIFGGGLYLILRKKKRVKMKITKNQEAKIMFKPNYAPNIIYRINGINTRNITFNYENTTNNEPQIIKEHYDIIMGILDKNEEIKNNIKYEYYNAFISVLNITVENKTNTIMAEYDKNISQILNKKNLRRMEDIENISKILDNNTKPFMKFDFYKNGEIKQINLPINLSDTYLTYLKELIEVIIPKLNNELFSSNINQTFKDYYKNYSNLYEGGEISENESEYDDEYNDDDYDDEYNENDDEFRVIRNLEKNFTEVNTSYLTSEISSNLQESEESQPILDLREFTKDEKNSNISCINQIKFIGGQNKYGESKGSSINTTIKTIVNETSGTFKNIYYVQKSLFKNELDSESNDTVYDDNNGITREILNDTSSSDINISLTSIDIEYKRSLELVDYYFDENFINQMKNYLNEFSFEIYNETENNDIDLSMRRLARDILSNNLFNDKEITIEKNNKYGNKQLRKLEDDSYYGIKPFKYEKYLFKFNLLFEVNFKMVTELWTKDGKCKYYFYLNIGFLSIKITLSNIQTNLHLVIKNTQEMTRKLISLVNESNENLLQRNQNYSEIIINFEKNISQMFKQNYDFSYLFRDSLNNMYDNIINLAKNLSLGLIKLIDNTIIEYNKIDEHVKKDEIEYIVTIRNITKTQYIIYIQNMILDLEEFKNDTLLFLDNITNLIQTLENFQIDVIYDIQDQINECKLIFQNFMTNLYKSIEKGIKIFKNNFYDYTEEIISELFNVIDFLSYSINENEIFVNALEESSRLSAQKKLKSFKDIINSIIDYIYNSIISDFEQYYSKEVINDYLIKIENKSLDVMTKTKAKIHMIDFYELYVNNIDLIKKINDDVQQKLFDVVYNNIYNLSKIKPDFLNKSSNINILKEKLFTLTNKIINYTNSEIKDINEYIKNYSKEYKMKYEYLIDLNLYYFRKSFLDSSFTNLNKEFEQLVTKTIKEYIVSIINKNYELGSQYVKDVYNYVYSHRRYRYKILFRRNGYTKAYTDRFSGQLEKFQNFLYLIYSEKFTNIIEKNYYYLKNKIISYVDGKVKPIDSYYFNISLYKNNFYFLEQIINEICNLTYNINNYFTDNYLELKIKTNAKQTATTVLQPLNDRLLIDYNSPNSRIRKYANSYRSTTSYDCFYQKFKLGIINAGRKYKSFESRDNINKIIDNLDPVDKYIKNNVDLIYSNFIKRFDYYLKNIINYSQIFYDDLYKYVENKKNNDTNLNMLLDNYTAIYNEIINNESNLKLFSELYNKTQFNFDFNLINKYLENMDDIYFKIYYLNNKSSFLEYPIEIINSTSQLKLELINNKNYLKDNINILYRKVFNNIIIETNNYINSLHTFNLKYILSLSKHNEIMESYISKKYNFIKEKFKINELDLFNLSDLALNPENQNYFLNIINKTDFILENINYDDPINNTLNYYNEYYAKLIEDVNETFIIKNCTEYNETVENNDIVEHKVYNICSESFYISDKNYSRYNFNIVKLRTAIYYTKYLAQNLYSTYSDFDFKNILNVSNICERDEILNDKNIINLFNETNNILISINEKSLEMIEEPQSYLIEAFKKKYTYENDYTQYVNYFYDIINFKNSNYTENVISYMDNLKKDVKILIDFFKQNLNKQLSNAKNYIEYNFDMNNFNKTFSDFNNEIKKSLSNYENIINNFNNSYSFHNSIKNVLRELQIQKREYFKKLFDEKQKNYDFPFLNISMNLEELIENYMDKDYENYCFDYIDNYVEIFINSTLNYQNNIVKMFKIIKNEILFNITKFYNDFYYEFNNNKNAHLTHKFVIEYTDNYTSCLNYSYDNLNNTINEDKLIYEDYLQKLQLLKLLNESKYMNNTNFINTTNYTNITINETDLLNLTYFNKTEHLLFCHENNYFNKSLYYYTDFDIEIKSELINISKNIDSSIQKHKVDEEYLVKFLKNNIKLENYTTSIDDLNYYIEDIASMSNYANLKYELPTYKNLLIDLSYKFFNESYINFIDKFIINDVNSKINIYFLQPLLNQLNIIENKIDSEFIYYKLLLSNTDKIGYSSKNAFLQLFKSLKNKLNETINELLKEYIDDNFYIFYRENKKIFRNDFINYILNNKISHIYKLEEFMDEILFEHDINFNNTLDNISSTLINDHIIFYFKDKIYLTIKNKLDLIFTMIDKNEIEFSNILDNIHSIYYDEYMSPTEKEVERFSIIVNNQTNRFSFSFSLGNETFNAMYDFTSNYLKPPIVIIENKYNETQELILQKIEKIIKTFPDGYQIVVGNLTLDKKLENVNETIQQIEYYFNEYYDEFNNEINSYYNKLVRFSFINGLRTFDNEIDYRFDIENTRLLEELTNNKNNDFEKEQTYIYKKYKNKTIDIKTFNKYKRKLSYTNDEYISKINIMVLALDMQNNLNKFNKSYIGIDYDEINLTLIMHLAKQKVYLTKMSQNLDQTLVKFLSFLTEDNYNELKNLVYKQYFQIEDFINNNYSTILTDSTDNFLIKLNSTSLPLNYIYNSTYDQIFNYYNSFYQMINDKFKIISNEDFSLIETFNKEKDAINSDSYKSTVINFNDLKNRTSSDINQTSFNQTSYNNDQTDFNNDQTDDQKKITLNFLMKHFPIITKNLTNHYETINNEVNEIVIKIKNLIENLFHLNNTKYENETINQIIKNFELDNKTNIEENFLNIGFKTSISKEIEELQKIIKPIPLFIPYLYLNITPIVEINFYIKLGTDNSDEEKSNLIYINCSVGGSVNISAGIIFSLNLGIVKYDIGAEVKGFLGTGDFGFKINLEFKEEELNIDIYMLYVPFKLDFYVVYIFEIYDESFSKFESYSHSIPLLGTKIENHSSGSVKPNQQVISSNIKQKLKV